MKIGWTCYGFIHQDFIAADGAANIRVPIINKLLKHNEIHFLGPQRQQTHNEIKFYNISNKFEKDYGINKKQNKDLKIKDFMNNYKFDGLPELDLLFIETNAMGLRSCYFCCLIKYYLDKNIRVIIWDEDNLYTNFKSHLSKLNIDINDILVLTPHSTKINKNQKTMYYPYNLDNELKIVKGNKICYIGNDYRRRERLKLFYDNRFSDIYGKYENKEFNDSLKAELKGSIKPNEVHNICNKYLASVQVVRNDYSKLGLMTQRMNEVLESGTILLADIKIKDIMNFVDKEYLVINGTHVQEKYDWLNSMSDEEYIKRVQQQRIKLQNITTKYNKIINLIENK